MMPTKYKEVHIHLLFRFLQSEKFRRGVKVEPNASKKEDEKFLKHFLPSTKSSIRDLL